MFISKLRSKVKPKNIETFQDLYINKKKIIVKGEHFVSDFFQDSGSEAVKRVLGQLDIRLFNPGDHQDFRPKFEKIISDINAGSHVYVEDLHNFEVWLENLKLGVSLDSFHFSSWKDQSPAGYIFPKVSFGNLRAVHPFYYIEKFKLRA